MNALAQAAQRFPLVARGRPACQSLDERIREVGDLAQAAIRQTCSDRLSLAATAHNKAALIASDCGLPDLARSLCLQQFNLYLRAQPLDAQTAQYALEPIVNLARLLIRDGDDEDAYLLLDTLYQAVRFRTDAVIAGGRVSFRSLTGSDDDHRKLCQWLWTVLLADGTRALAGSGRWDQALASAEQRDGIGKRLLDGRQVAVLARCLAGDPSSALALLEGSELSAPWERAVAACLSVLCLRFATRPVDAAVTTMVGQYVELECEPELVVFRTRLGLAVIDLAEGAEQLGASRAVGRLVGDAVAAEDGYAARDVLGHRGCKAQLTKSEEQALTVAVRSSGLGRGAIPPELMAGLLAAVKTSEAATARALAISVLASSPK